MNNSYSVVLISFPHQVPYAFSCIDFDTQVNKSGNYSPLLVLPWAFDSESHKENSTFLNTLKLLIRKKTQIEIVRVSILWRYLLSPLLPLLFRVWVFRAIFRALNIDTVYISHDSSEDMTAQALMQATENARHIYFGDPPGFLQEQYIYKARHSLGDMGSFKRFIFNLRCLGVNTVLSPSSAYLAISFHEETNLSQKIEVKEIPIKLVKSTFEKMAMVIKSSITIDTCHIDTFDHVYILLLSNFSASKLTSVEQEVDMYVNACQSYIPRGKTIIVKPHFGSSSELVSSLICKLRCSHYQIVEYPNILVTVPIELSLSYFNIQKIISFSSASIMLTRLYIDSLKHALNDDVINGYFFPSSMNYMFEVNRKIEKELNSQYP